MIPPIFPAWTNHLKELLGVGAAGGLVYVVVVVWLGFSPKTIAVGYSPTQPVPYSHALHAGKLGMDCRYCHTTVESSAHAAIPPTQTCMGCHERVWSKSPKLAPLREKHAEGKPLLWRRVHDLPDYVYFNHSRHISSGVSCVECHGRVDTMDVVSLEKPLSMGWCLDCHRDPAPRLRPAEFITKLDWTTENPRALGEELMKKNGIQPSTDCSTCHR